MWRGRALAGRRPWAAASCALGVVMLAIYIVLIVAEGDDSVVEVLPWVLLMALSTGLALTAVLVRNRRAARRALLGAAVLFAVIGGLALFSIGIGLVLAAVFAFVGLTELRDPQSTKPAPHR